MNDDNEVSEIETPILPILRKPEPEFIVNTPVLMCEVCYENPAHGVYASQFGPISHAYCGFCLNAHREVYSTLVGGLIGVADETGKLTMESIRADLRPAVVETLAFNRLTFEQLAADVEEGTAAYEKHLTAQQVSDEDVRGADETDELPL